jgi:3-methyladenine DNA glycosylase/8-oxoguanine DNA glycosylase
MENAITEKLPLTVEKADKVVKQTKGKSKRKVKAIIKLANTIIDGTSMSKSHKKIAKRTVKLLKELL